MSRLGTCEIHYVVFYYFSYYGLQLWFPEYFKNLLEEGRNTTNTSDANQCTTHDTESYKDSLYEASASVPGNFIGLFVINVIGGKLLLSKWTSLYVVTRIQSIRCHQDPEFVTYTNVAIYMKCCINILA